MTEFVRLPYWAYAPICAPVPDAPWQIEDDLWRRVPVTIPVAHFAGPLVGGRCDTPVTVAPGFIRKLRSAIREWAVDTNSLHIVLAKSVSLGVDWSDIAPPEMGIALALPKGGPVRVRVNAWCWNDLKDLPIYRGWVKRGAREDVENALHRVARLWGEFGEDGIASRVADVKCKHVRRMYPQPVIIEPDPVE